MKILKKAEKLIFESNTFIFVFSLTIITIFKTGIWCIPSFNHQVLMAQNPFVNPLLDPSDHYIFYNWLGPFIAWFLGAKSFYSMIALHFLFSIAFYLFFIKKAFSIFSNAIARSSIILFNILPVSATAFFWVGLDSITLLLMMLALSYPKRLVVVFTVGVLLGMQHFEQSLVAISGLLLAVSLSKKQSTSICYSVKFCILLIGGIFVGKLTLMGIFSYYSIQVNSGRIYKYKIQYIEILESFFLHFQSVVWSILGLGWFIALRYIDWGRRTIPFFVSLGILCLVTLVVLDQTRVLSIITFPLATAYWLLNKDFLNKISKREISLIFIAWVIMPWSWTFIGEPKWSVFPYDVAYVLHELFGWDTIPPSPHSHYWPFLSTYPGEDTLK
jgi:hypothetical protein